jgi:murein DD-endopeptidase MepM/ murein hydrolase activator NlpD
MRSALSSTIQSRRSLAVWLALGALAASLCGGASEAARISSRQRAQVRKGRIQALRNRLHTLREKKKEKRAQIRQMKRTQRRLSDQLNDSYERLERAKHSLAVSEKKLRKARADVDTTTARLRAAEVRLALQRRRFGRRLALSYQEGSVSYADVLLGSRNLSDFLDRQYYVSRVTSQDAELLTNLREAQELVLRERRRMLEVQQVMAAAHQENRDLVRQVAQEAQERETILQAIERERALQEQRLAELEEDSMDVQHSLERELARRLANPNGFRNLPRWSGSLFLPARGPITSRFGYRFHPVLRYRRLHAGVDIGAPAGSGVYSASSGEVFFASWRGGYGQCIIVLHGGGMSTLYGHLSRIFVRPGQTVRRGQLIGAVGSTGLSSGPHLHFETRRNGVPVNPL